MISPTLHVRVSDECNSPEGEYEIQLRAFLLDHDLDDDEVSSILAGDCVATMDGSATLKVQLASVANGRRF